MRKDSGGRKELNLPTCEEGGWSMGSTVVWSPVNAPCSGDGHGCGDMVDGAVWGNVCSQTSGKPYFKAQ